MKARIRYALAGILFFLTPLSASLLATVGLYPLGILVGLILLIAGGVVLSFNLRARVTSATNTIL